MPTITPIENPQQATPEQIDERVAEYSHRLAQAQQTLAFYMGPKARNSFRLEESIERAQTEVAKYEDLLAPLQVEFSRRGGWQRAFFCTAHGGHVHRTLDCTTCGPRTSFTWQTWLSGKSEQEIIDAIGETACTVCYPTAPVAMMTTEERNARKQQRSQEAREAKAAERAAKAAAKLAAQMPRLHSLAIKVDEFVNEFGLDASKRREAYEATWGEGSRFAKGYDTAASTWTDLVEEIARRAA